MPTQFPLISSVPTTFDLATYNGVLPNKVTLTGTFSSSGVTVTGTGTLFTTELQSLNWSVPKMYLYNASTGELRSIKNINSDTSLILNAAFAVNLAGATLYGVSTSLGQYNRVQIVSSVVCTVGKLDLPVESTVADEVYLIDGTGYTPVAAVSVTGASGTLYIGGDLISGGGGGGGGGWGYSGTVATLTGASTLNPDDNDFQIKNNAENAAFAIGFSSATTRVAVLGANNGVGQSFFTAIADSTGAGYTQQLLVSDGTTTTTVNIDAAAKTLGIDNTGHDVKVGINTATPSVALDVVGGASFGQIVDNGGNIVIFQQTTGQTIDISTVADCDIYLTTSGTGAIALTAASGVTTSAGLTVGGGFAATAKANKSNDYVVAATDQKIYIIADSNTVEIGISNAMTEGQIVTIYCRDKTFAATVAGLRTGLYIFANANDCIVVQWDNDLTEGVIIAEYLA